MCNKRKIHIVCFNGLIHWAIISNLSFEHIFKNKLNMFLTMYIVFQIKAVD